MWIETWELLGVATAPEGGVAGVVDGALVGPRGTLVKPRWEDREGIDRGSEAP